VDNKEFKEIFENMIEKPENYFNNKKEVIDSAHKEFTRLEFTNNNPALSLMLLDHLKSNNDTHFEITKNESEQYGNSYTFSERGLRALNKFTPESAKNDANAIKFMLITLAEAAKSNNIITSEEESNYLLDIELNIKPVKHGLIKTAINNIKKGLSI